MSIALTSLIENLPSNTPFVGPEALERRRGSAFNARIGANESAFGISPQATAALHEAIDSHGCNWYGDPENHELRALLATKHGVKMDNICVDSGIDSLLGLAVRLLTVPGTTVVTSQGGYPTFNYHVNGYGGVLHTAPYKDNHEDPDALLAKAREHKAKLVYLANPDNPMGTCLSAERVQSMINNLPDQCLMLLDEAYADYMTEQAPPSIDIANPQVIRLRTFSKAYGMAGMRIGYAIAHKDLIIALNKIRNHFGVNRLAQVAAIASVQDGDFLSQVLKSVEDGRQRIYTLAKTFNLAFIPSSTNFVTVDMGSVESADKVLQALNDAQVFIRKPGMAPHNRYIRIGIGTDAEHHEFARVFTNIL